MKCIYLHIGLHKTGTTSIQYFLNRNADILASAGINVMKKFIAPRYGHHNIAWGLQSNHPRFSTQLPTFEDVVKFIEASKDNAFLLSSEEFSKLDDRGIDTIRKGLDKCKVIIIIYIRNQADWLSSMYTEAAKKTILPNLEEYVKHKIAKEWNILNYYRLYNRWSSIFGSDCVIVRIYENQKNVVQGFFDTLDITIDPRLFEFPKYNTSLNTRFTLANQYVIKWFNRLYPNENYREHLLGQIIATARELKEYTGRTALCSTDKAQWILNRFEKSNRELASALDIELPESYFLAASRSVEEYEGQDIQANAMHLLLQTIARQKKVMDANSRSNRAVD